MSRRMRQRMSIHSSLFFHSSASRPPESQRLSEKPIIQTPSKWCIRNSILALKGPWQSPAAMFRVILHLDMDAFYASVEQRDNPKLRGRPVIVGAPPNQRGVVCAASYEARKFGVRSALPSATAGRLCPKGIFVRPRMDCYRAESQHIMAIMAATGAVIEPMSIGRGKNVFVHQDSLSQ
jgi:hypothetical protein